MNNLPDQINQLLESSPYSYNGSAKQELLLPLLIELVKFHYDNCKEYRNILDALQTDISAINTFEQLPFLPVELFKQLTLSSVPPGEISQTMSSSGTTSQLLSKIYLDKQTAFLQKRVLAKISAEFIGRKRRPMVVIDVRSSISNRQSFSARAAAILGFSSFSKSQFFALKDDMTLDIDGLREYLAAHESESIFFFGFTYMIWEFFLRPLSESNSRFNLGNATLIHGGGWKKLTNTNVSSEQFRNEIFRVTGLRDVHDYYGMVEQTGSIFVECSEHYLHASNFSTIIIRDAFDFSALPFNQIGLVEVISVVTLSYPGQVILTEDLGRILGEDDCVCGMHGRYFEILGRIENAEIRGCSDTFVV